MGEIALVFPSMICMDCVSMQVELSITIHKSNKNRVIYFICELGNIMVNRREESVYSWRGASC